MTYDPRFPPGPNNPPPPQYPPFVPPPGYTITPPHLQEASSKKVAAGLCAILIGTLGIHKFILGYTGAGLTMLLVSILTCGLGAIVMHIIALIEGITYLTKSDQQFYDIYIANRKEWF